MLTKPTSTSSAARAVTQPKLWGRIVSHHPGTAVPPYEATRSVISASDSGPRHRRTTPLGRLVDCAAMSVQNASWAIPHVIGVAHDRNAARLRRPDPLRRSRDLVPDRGRGRAPGRPPAAAPTRRAGRNARL